MNTLVLTNGTGKDITTSLIIAEVFGKEHKHVLRDIQELECPDDFRQSNFGLSSYITSQGKELPMYEITKDGFSFLAMGYTGSKAAEFKVKFINEFNKREAMLKNDDYILVRSQEILSGRMKMLEQQLRQKDERLQLQDHVITQSAPKVEYYEEVLQSESLIATNVIAKELGMSAVSLNKLLNKLGIIYRSGSTWVLYHKYQALDYTGTKTASFTDSQGNKRTEVHTYWTEAGREFIHNTVKEKVKTIQQLTY